MLLFQLHGGTTQRGRVSSGQTSLLENWKITGVLAQSSLRYNLLLPSLMWFECVVSEDLEEGGGIPSV